MLRRLTPVLVLSALAAGCGVDEDNFTEKAAEVTCGYVERCYLGDFVDKWDDMTECVEDTIDDTEKIHEELNDRCDFDREKADRCLDSYREATRSCDEDDIEWDDCLEIWDDC